VGPNGAGKTTLLRCLAGLEHRHLSHVRLDGQPLSQLTARQRAKRIAFVPQNPLMPLGMTVRSYIALGRAPHGGRLWNNLECHSLVDLALTTLDLSSLQQRQVASLSGGEQRRATLARAIAQGCDVLVMDEPTAALDVGRTMEILELLDQLRLTQGISVVTALHDLPLVAQFADHVILMRSGTVEATGAPEMVLTEDWATTTYRTTIRQTTVGTHEVLIPTRDPSCIRARARRWN
jgi:iron complex transport system ATP-binding protein